MLVANKNLRSVVYVAPFLPVDLRNQIQSLERAALLQEVVTSYVYLASGWIERAVRACDGMLGTHLSALLQQRKLAGVSAQRIRRRAVPELWRIWRLQKGRNPDREVQELDQVTARADRRATRLLGPTTRLVIASEETAFHCFQAAKRLGIGSLYNLPTAHYATVCRIVEEEIAAFPGICTAPGPSSAFTPERLHHKDVEVRNADHFLVPSRFVQGSLLHAGIDAERISVLPFGSEPTWLCSERVACRNVVVHVGNLSLRKGTHRLLRAWKRLGAYRTHRLHLIGNMLLAPNFLKDYQGCFEHLGRLPREELRRHYQEAAGFVLPALAEGFAMVILEALACGCPVVVSRNSGAEGFITEGQEGLFHEARDDDSLCENLDWLLSHPREREQMSQAARVKARSWTWGEYGQHFLQLICRLMEPEGKALPLSISRV